MEKPGLCRPDQHKRGAAGKQVDQKEQAYQVKMLFHGNPSFVCGGWLLPSVFLVYQFTIRNSIIFYKILPNFFKRLSKQKNLFPMRAFEGILFPSALFTRAKDNQIIFPGLFQKIIVYCKISYPQPR